MFLILSRILSRPNCILVLMIFNLASSAPLKSQKQIGQGFSSLPKILEIQLPLKIASKEDLVAWSKYVSSLVASKINTSNLKSSPSAEKQIPFISNTGLKSNEALKKAPLNEKRLNYPARRLKEPPVQKADDMVVAYPLPMGAMKPTASSRQDPSSLPTSSFNGPADFGQYPDYNLGIPYQQGEIDFGNFDILTQPPSNTYLPVSSPIDITKPHLNDDKNTSDFEEPAKLQTVKDSLNLKTHNNEYEQALPIAANNGLAGLNFSYTGEPLLSFPFQAVITVSKEPPGAMVTKNQPTDYTALEDIPSDLLSFFDQNYTLMNESGQVNVVFNDFITDTSETKAQENVKKEKEKKKEQNVREQKKQSQKSQSQKKQSQKSQSQKVQNQKNQSKKVQSQKNQNQKKAKSSNKQKSSIKRQSSVLGDLLRTLGILRKLPKNTTEINVATPVLSILKGTNSQKIQVSFDETPPNRERRNETFLAQQLEEDDNNDDDDENGNGENGNDENGNDENDNDENDNDENGNGDNENDEDDDDGNEPQIEAQEEDEDDEEEEEGGSIQALIELLPLAAPILEELSDPESDVDIVEVIQGAIPLLEGLSDPEEEGGVDLPSVLLPLSQKISGGPEGQSDSGAILGPIIQLIAPLIGPLSGPLLGPLSRSSSGPAGSQGSTSIFTASAGPLSKPQGPYGQSVLSSLIASITSKLSKESAASADESDVKSLVSSIVSGVLAGASAGSSGHKNRYGHSQYGQNNYNANAGYGQSNPSSYNGNKDTYHSSTSYGSYGPPPPQMQEGSSAEALLEPFKEAFGAFLKLSGTSSTSSATLSGGSSSTSTGLSTSSSQSSEKPATPTYGPPTSPPYSAPSPPPPSPSYNSYASPPSTNSPYVSFTRRQIARQQIKNF